ncbi:M23 family metallopeptidase [Salinispira pacifica]|uniref:Uncharacterized protein n=1 Tax=Salinispira pacifica TaxID=1307761 RepID=V5WF18_9SPIO|nr:M23 family metallopeptidase [Salinispira pacifica]AHC14397.1 hypothetical protein L21SP2_0979 [Salinispira pacifica]
MPDNEKTGSRSKMKDNFKYEGDGEMGRIMSDFLMYNMREGRGMSEAAKPVYERRMWDDDGSWIEAPSIRGVVNIGVSITASFLAPGVGGALMGAALNLVDDAMFTAMDVQNGVMTADEAWVSMGKQALSSVASAAIGQIGPTGDAFKALGAGAKVGLTLGHQVATNTVTGAINAIEYSSEGGWGYNGEAFRESVVGKQALAGYVGSVAGGMVQHSIADSSLFGFVGEDYANGMATATMAGNLVRMGTDYAITGSTSINLANINGVGLFEVNLGRDGIRGSISSGGYDMSMGTIINSIKGIGTLQTSADIGKKFDGDLEVAMRGLSSYGLDETDEYFRQLMNGEAEITIADGDGTALTEYDAETQTKRTRIDHAGDGQFAGIQLGVVLAHEAFRNGIDDGERGQQIETSEAVFGHTVAAGMAAGIYGDSSISQAMLDEVELLREAQRTKDFSKFSAHVAANYDSSKDYWKLTAEGELINDGDGWLRDENGDLVRNENGDPIGANGVETGLLNILYGGTSGRSYDNFSDEEIATAQQLMVQSGMTSTDVPMHERMWTGNADNIHVPGLGSVPVNLTALNMGKKLDMNSVMSKTGDSIATEAFVNYYYGEAHDAAKSGFSQLSSAMSNVPLTAQGRFGRLSATMTDFYGNGSAVAQKLSQEYGLEGEDFFGPSTNDKHSLGMHKGNDFGMPEGTAVPSIFSGVASVIDRTDDYDPLTGEDSSGLNVQSRIGFTFEDLFIDTGVDSNSMHFSSIPEDLEVGSEISSNMTIGYAGDSGASDGSHLHQQFTLRRGYGKPATMDQANPYRARQNSFLDFVGAPLIGAS